MKKFIFSFFTIMFMFSLSWGYAQKDKKSKEQSGKEGHNLLFEIKNSNDSILYLAVHYQDKLILQDSTKPMAPEKFLFKGSKKYPDGLYTIAGQQKKPYLNFIIDRNQSFRFVCDTAGSLRDVVIINSPENVEVLAFQQKTATSQVMAGKWRDKKAYFEKINNKDSVDFYTKKLNGLNDEMLAFIKDLIAKNPDALFSKMQKAYQMIDVPEPPRKPDGTIDSSFQAIYYRTHYWDNVDLKDNRLIYTPVLYPKMQDYFGKLLEYQEPDTINKYIDLLLNKIEGDSLYFRYFVGWLAYHYETSKIIGHDAVFVHIVKNNHLKHKCPWVDETLYKKYEKRIATLEPLLIGKKSVELIMPDTSLTDDFYKWHSSYREPSKYVILWFFDPDCQTCKQETKKLKTIYDSLDVIGKRNFSVYAVSIDEDIDRWKEYIKKNNLTWTNVGGNKANVNFRTVYDVTGVPVMFILNERREIILNKRIDMNNVPTFLEQYEKGEALKKKMKQN